MSPFTMKTRKTNPGWGYLAVLKEHESGILASAAANGFRLFLDSQQEFIEWKVAHRSYGYVLHLAKGCGPGRRDDILHCAILQNGVQNQMGRILRFRWRAVLQGMLH